MVNELSRTRSDLLRLYAAAIRAVDAERAVNSVLQEQGPLEVREILAKAQAVRVLAIGKAAPGMAAGASQSLCSKLRDGLVIAPDGTALPTLPAHFRVMRASHPLPDASSEAAGRAALEFVKRCEARDIVLMLLSGGASALMAAPAEAVALADKVAITAGLMRTSAPIAELNAVRKHLSAVKGGGLLRALTTGAQMLSLILSDVPGNDLATIGSGPAVADPTTFADAIGILKRRKLWGRAPEAVRDRLERGMAGELPETLKSGDPLLQRVTSVIVGDNAVALEAIATMARELGYQVAPPSSLRGEAEPIGRTLARQLSEINGERACVIAGGEPVVTVTGSGKGGRAQHCALAMALGLEQASRNPRMMALFAGTDGIDGPTDAAGAIVSAVSMPRAREAGIDPQAALSRCDSYNVFAALGDLLMTGPTGTNVGDVFIGLVNF